MLSNKKDVKENNQDILRGWYYMGLELVESLHHLLHCLHCVVALHLLQLQTLNSVHQSIVAVRFTSKHRLTLLALIRHNRLFIYIKNQISHKTHNFKEKKRIEIESKRLHWQRRAMKVCVVCSQHCPHCPLHHPHYQRVD